MRGLASLVDRVAEERLAWNDTGTTWFQPSVNGTNVTADSAYQLSAVWACQTLIADSIATLPVDTYRRKTDRRESTTPPGWVETPNKEMDRLNYDTQRILSLLSWGNAYSLLVRENGSTDPMAPVVERWPLDPARVHVTRDPSPEPTLAYFIYGERIPITLLQHIRGYVRPGWSTGMGVVQNARLSMGLALGAEVAGKKFYDQGMMLSGVLEVPQMPADVNGKVLDGLREQFAERYAGSGNAGKPAVLTGGTKYTQVTVNPSDAQFLETRRFQIEEIARWHRVPLHKIQQVHERTSQGGGNGLEQMSTEFSQDALLPWVRRIEIADSALLKRGQYLRYNLDAYVRADLATRYEAYNKGRLGGWLSANDILRKEDEPPIPNGDIYLQPANMVEAGAYTEGGKVQTEPIVPDDGGAA